MEVFRLCKAPILGRRTSEDWETHKSAMCDVSEQVFLLRLLLLLGSSFGFVGTTSLHYTTTRGKLAKKGQKKEKLYNIFLLNNKWKYTHIFFLKSLKVKSHNKTCKVGIWEKGYCIELILDASLLCQMAIQLSSTFSLILYKLTKGLILSRSTRIWTPFLTLQGLIED